MAYYSASIVHKLPEGFDTNILMASLYQIENDLRLAFGVSHVSGGFASLLTNEYTEGQIVLLAQIGVISDIDNHFHTIVYKVPGARFDHKLYLADITSCEWNHTYSKDNILYPFFWLWPHDSSLQEWHISGFWNCANCNRTYRDAVEKCSNCGTGHNDETETLVEDVLVLSDLTGVEKWAIAWAFEERMAAFKPTQLYEQFTAKALRGYKPADTHQAVLALRMNLTIDIMTVYARAINPNNLSQYDEAYNLAMKMIDATIQELSIAEFTELKTARLSQSK